MTRLAEIMCDTLAWLRARDQDAREATERMLRNTWNCLIKPPPSDPQKTLKWLQDQEEDAYKATERIRQERIRKTELAFRKSADFLDDELLPPERRKRNP